MKKGRRPWEGVSAGRVLGFYIFFAIFAISQADHVCRCKNDHVSTGISVFVLMALGGCPGGKGGGRKKEKDDGRRLSGPAETDSSLLALRSLCQPIFRPLNLDHPQHQSQASQRRMLAPLSKSLTCGHGYVWVAITIFALMER